MNRRGFIGICFAAYLARFSKVEEVVSVPQPVSGLDTPNLNRDLCAIPVMNVSEYVDAFNRNFEEVRRSIYQIE